MVSARESYLIMSLLKSLANSIDIEKVVEEKKSRQLRTNPNSKPFNMNFPVVTEKYNNSDLINRITKTCRRIGDVQKKSSNVQASMTGWFMHETDEDFMEVVNLAINLAQKNSPSIINLMPYDCWGAIYQKGEYTKPHDHWPQIWSWVYNVECCNKCAPLVFPDYELQEQYSLVPQKGNLTLFPGWVKHYVPEHKCNHDRIILAGNLGVNPWELISGMEKRSAANTIETFSNPYK